MGSADIFDSLAIEVIVMVGALAIGALVSRIFWGGQLKEVKRELADLRQAQAAVHPAPVQNITFVGEKGYYQPQMPPASVGSGQPIRAHADVSTGQGTAQAGPWSEPEMVARLDTKTHTAHIGTTKGEMTLPLGPAPHEHEPMLQAVLEWLIEKDLLAALPNATPPLAFWANCAIRYAWERSPLSELQAVHTGRA